MNPVLRSSAAHLFVSSLEAPEPEPAEAKSDEKSAYANADMCPECGTISLIRAAKGRALLEGNAFVTPDDVKRMAPAVLRHRIVLTYEAEAEEISTEDIIRRLFEQIQVP